MTSVQACLTNIYCYVIVKKNRVCCFTGHLHVNMYSLFKCEYTSTHGFIPAIEELSACWPGYEQHLTVSASAAPVARLGSR